MNNIVNDAITSDAQPHVFFGTLCPPETADAAPDGGKSYEIA